MFCHNHEASDKIKVTLLLTYVGQEIYGVLKVLFALADLMDVKYFQFENC